MFLLLMAIFYCATARFYYKINNVVGRNTRINILI